MNEWKAYHIFYFDEQKQEKMLCECVAPMMKHLQKRGEIEKWFFTRCWEGGPHIRLLFVDKANTEEKISEILQKYLEVHPSEGILPRQYYFQSRTSGAERAEESLLWKTDNTIVVSEYEREYEYYGGKEAIPFCENIFMSSSEIAVKLIEATESNPATRISAAVDLILVILYQAKIRPKYFSSHYSSSWKELFKSRPIQNHYVKWLQSAIRIGSINDRVYTQRLCGELYKMMEEDMKSVWDICGRDIDQVYDICIWLVHMLNNRLGIIPDMEQLVVAQVVQEMEKTEYAMAD